MTIRPDLVIHHDAFAAEGPLPEENAVCPWRRGRRPAVSAATLRAVPERVPHYQTAILCKYAREMASELFDELSQTCPHRKLAYYAGYNGRVWNNVIARRKGLWNRSESYSQLQRLASGTGSEICTVDGNWLEFFGVLPIVMAALDPALELTRRTGTSAVLYVEKLRAERKSTLRALTNAAHGQSLSKRGQCRFDWWSFIEFTCGMGEIVVRCVGDIDDPTCAVQVFWPARDTRVLDSVKSAELNIRRKGHLQLPPIHSVDTEEEIE